MASPLAHTVPVVQQGFVPIFGDRFPGCYEIQSKMWQRNEQVQCDRQASVAGRPGFADTVRVAPVMDEGWNEVAFRFRSGVAAM